MKLKVCGMKYRGNMEAVALIQPDYLGFIFYEKSSRFFEGNIPDLAKTIKKVGVFVDAPLEFITEKIKTHNLQAVQLHGKESPLFCKKLKSSYHSEHNEESHHKDLNQNQDNKSEVSVISSQVEIIKVFSIKDDFNFSVLEDYEDVCDYFLFDTKGELPGGNGFTFNWNVLKNYPSSKPFFLSGGIGLNEIEKLKKFKTTEVSKYCYAIDVNSKFEIQPGLKHIEDLEKFKTNVTSSNF